MKQYDLCPIIVISTCFSFAYWLHLLINITLFNNSYCSRLSSTYKAKTLNYKHGLKLNWPCSGI